MDENFLNEVAFAGEAEKDGVKYRFKDYLYISEVYRCDDDELILVAKYHNKENRWEVI